MNTNGRVRPDAPTEAVLHWDGKVVTAAELDRALHGQRELIVSPRAVVTPLALDRLRESGVALRRVEKIDEKMRVPPWSYAQDQRYPLVESAVQSLQREGVSLKNLIASETTPSRWARSLADCVARGGCTGAVAFCNDPGVVCCVANKVAGVRAAAVMAAGQVRSLVRTLAPNLVAVEMPGRTFFEIRRIFCTLLAESAPKCPKEVSCILQELDGHAHR